MTTLHVLALDYLVGVYPLALIAVTYIAVSLQTPQGEYLNQSYLYNAGETPYFGREHLPYGVLAVVMLTVFNILPVILLFLYLCSCCHKCLNCCYLSRPALVLQS